MSVAAAVAAALVIVLALRLRPRATRSAVEASSGSAPSITAPLERVAAVVRRRRQRRAGPAPAAVAEWCGDLARAIRSGDSLRVALGRTVPTDATTRLATDPLRLGLERGRTIPESAGEPVAEPEAAALRHLMLALSIIAECAHIGGSAAAPLDRVAATLRQRAADDQERAAQAAQARLSAHVLTLIPVAVLGLLLIVDDAVRAAVLSPVGLACVLSGVALNVGGWSWMRHIIGPA